MSWGLGDIYAFDGRQEWLLRFNALQQSPQSPNSGRSWAPGVNSTGALVGAPGGSAYGIGRSARYSPQFAQPGPPAGFWDEEFEHVFNSVTTPAFSSSLPSGASLRDVPLDLETDAEFVVQGIRIFDGNTPFLTVQLREPRGKLLMPEGAPVPLLQSFISGGVLLFPTGAVEFMTIPLEPEVLCPAGGVFLFYVTNPTAAPVALDLTVTFFGVKRRSNACN